MATTIGSVGFSWGSYSLAYDLLSQSTTNNTSTVRLYGILNVTGSYVSWSRGSASVHTSGLQQIGTYYGNGSHIVILRDYTFTHDSNGNFSTTIGASLSTTYTSGSCSGILTLPKITRFATITSAIGNFNDEDNPWFKFSNPANSSMSCWLEINPNGEHLCTRTVNGSSGTYTWALTETERKQLRAKLPNSNTGKIRIGLYSTIGGVRKASYVDRTYTIINANPIFNDFEFEDTNTTTTALTGNNQDIIINYSNIKATINTINKAEAIKEATMTKYRLSSGEITADINYSDDSSVSVLINNANSGTINLYAIDSRNNSTMVTKLANNIINYENIYIDKQNSSLQRNNNQVGQSAILTLNGTFWNGDFGNVFNDITSVTYRLKKTDSNVWIDGTTQISVSITDNNFTFTGQIASDNLDTNWNLESSYNVEITVSDELSSATVNFILNSGVPTLCLDKEGVGIMCAYDTNLGGGLQVNGSPIIDAGEGYIKYNNGTMICYGQTTATVSCSSSWGNLYYGRINNDINFAEEFIEIPNIITDIQSTTSTGLINGKYDSLTITKTKVSGFSILRPTSNNNVGVRIVVIAIGKWK